jgi:hypothetical protein
MSPSMVCIFTFIYLLIVYVVLCTHIVI